MKAINYIAFLASKLNLIFDFFENSLKILWKFTKTALVLSGFFFFLLKFDYFIFFRSFLISNCSWNMMWLVRVIEQLGLYTYVYIYISLQTDVWLRFHILYLPHAPLNWWISILYFIIIKYKIYHEYNNFLFYIFII